MSGANATALLPRYADLWVVSDIHMGGERDAERNFQIFHRGKRLASFVDSLIAPSPADDVALVLNGDIIDSLAEEVVPGYVALDVGIALLMMERLYVDEAFAPVWDALARFVRTPRRHLVLVLGNHDVELALPPVQASVRQRLAGEDAAADGRITFATQGGGFACMVGGARVFCTHGNEVDAWNEVDYGRLAQLANAMNAGRRIDSSRWEPNAGTRLVVDVMNRVKERHPFVDLLKPEIKPVLGVLLTLDPGLVREIDFGKGYGVVRELLRGDRRVSDLLSATDQDLSVVPAPHMAHALVHEVLGSNLAEHIQTAQRSSEDELLIAAELAGTVSAALPGATGTLTRAAAPAADQQPETLGFRDIVAGWIGRLDPPEALRRALLDWIGEDGETFALGTRDETFESIVARVGPDVDFVVTGHTHLARSIDLGSGRRYFNCGTWIRLLRLTPQLLADRARFEATAYRAFTERRMSALDDATIPGPDPGTSVPLVIDRTNVVRIWRMPGGVRAELRRVVDDDGHGTNVRTEPQKDDLRS